MTKLRWQGRFQNFTRNDQLENLDPVSTAGEGEILYRSSNWIVDDHDAAVAFAKADGRPVQLTKRKVSRATLERVGRIVLDKSKIAARRRGNFED